MKWFRMYSDLLNDPKVQTLDPVAFKHWINLLCIANNGSPRGSLPDTETLAYQLRISADECALLLQTLNTQGLLDMSESGVSPHNWHARQYASDNVTLRTKKHREHGGNVPGTFQSRSGKRSMERSGNENGTPPDNREQNTDTEIPPKSPDGFDQWWSAYPKKDDKERAIRKWRNMSKKDQVAATLGLEPWLKSHPVSATNFYPGGAVWLNNRRWEDPDPDPVPHNASRGWSMPTGDVYLDQSE